MEELHPMAVTSLYVAWRASGVVGLRLSKSGFCWHFWQKIPTRGLYKQTLKSAINSLFVSYSWHSTYTDG